jgi:hypothetical protein
MLHYGKLSTAPDYDDYYEILCVNFPETGGTQEPSNNTCAAIANLTPEEQACIDKYDSCKGNCPDKGDTGNRDCMRSCKGGYQSCIGAL